MFAVKILKKDFLRKKSATIVVFAFIMLSALLVSGGSNLIVELINSLNTLFEKADTPHFVQMHAGEINLAEIDRWAESNTLVQKHQSVEMITMDGSSMFFGENSVSEENSIMDISFVKQNSSFDFLLDLNNNLLNVLPGNIAVPIYYMQQKNLKIGDTIRIKGDSSDITFVISAFSRDAQMNPAIVHSKRFLINESDYVLIGKHFQGREYLIEFILNDIEKINEFSETYSSSGLPSKGPAVDYNLFKVLNALTDSIAAGVIIILSSLLMIIALLCLRFTIIITIEEDSREIGVMKAIGVSKGEIRKIYLSRYMLTGALASMLGYLASLFFNQFFSSNIMLYIGNAPKSPLQQSIPAISAFIIFLIVTLSCVIILRRFNSITAIEALRQGNTGGSFKAEKLFRLKKTGISNVNIFLGARDLLLRFRMFGLLCFVFFFCSCFIIIPVHFLNTINSPAFIAYMGIGRSDIRIDLRQSDNIAERFSSMISRISDDNDVHRFSPLVTSRFIMINGDGAEESINIETGDFSIFPLDYLKGRAPEKENEITLSFLNSREMDKSIDDKIRLFVNGVEKEMTICGIYQDVTNGGRTAKGLMPYNRKSVLWYTLSLDLKPGISIENKVHEYSESFHPARVTDLGSYLKQTLGSTINQLKKVTIAASAVGLFVSVLITSLFLKMLITRDSSQIAIMKSLGFSIHNIRIQYLTRSLLLLIFGITLGTIFANTLGESMVSLLWSFMGASQIRFVINPLQAYVFLPLILMLTVSITTIISITGINDTSIIEMITE